MKSSASEGEAPGPPPPPGFRPGPDLYTPKILLPRKKTGYATDSNYSFVVHFTENRTVGVRPIRDDFQTERAHFAASVFRRRKPLHATAQAPLVVGSVR